MRNYLVLFVIAGLVLSSCKKDEEKQSNTATSNGPNVVFKFRFDENQERLDNFGNPAVLPSSHAAQTPDFQEISAHYIELIENANTWLGDGEVVYQGAETNAGGDVAIDFDATPRVGEDEVFLSVPLSSLAPGTYEYLRVSLAYQKYKIDLQAGGFDLNGTLASFIGYNTYISNYTIDETAVEVNGNKLQGYWGFETLGIQSEGQAPEGATTVVNPLFDTSPIPAGSCLVTGEFATPLEIEGNESEDIEVIISLSVNNSFEWIDGNSDGIYQPENSEAVVDMGVRGMIPFVE
ncbi:MAG: hypothetical protein ACPGED_05185 [Flavobacteriales bacterium]